MNRHALTRAAALGCAGALLAGCGGGATSSLPRAGAATTAATPSNATGTLTIKYPAGFTTVRKGLAAKRHAAYVNPTAGNTLAVDVDGHPVPGSPFAVAATPDSSQTLTVPFYSTNSNVVSATEYDSNGDELAAGDTGSNAISAGGTAAVALTLQMNATRMGVTTDPVAGFDAELVDTAGSTPTPFCMTASSAVYPFAADPSAGYVMPGVPAGLGGIPAPALTSTTSPGTSRFGAEPLGYLMTFDGSNDPLTAYLSQTNPVPATGVNGVVEFFTGTVNTQTTHLPDCMLPAVVTEPTSTLVPPNGYKITTIPFSQPAMPVIAYGGYTYWAFADINNDVDFYIGKYDSQYNLISVTAFPGDRYIWQITIDQLGQTVTLLGQNAQCCAGPGVTIAWSALSGL